MTTMEPIVVEKRVERLRGNSFGAVVMLLTQYVLGIWVNLYATLPHADHGANAISGIGRAIANGPAGLTLHAILGLLLIVTGTTAVVRSFRIAQRPLVVMAGIALLAILVAGITGGRFVGTGDNGASFVMAVATAVAILFYVLILFVTGPLPNRSE